VNEYTAMGLMTVLQWIYDKFAVAIIILLAGFIIAKIAGKVVKRILAEAELNKILAKAKFTPVSDALGGIVEYALYVATVIVVLQQFGLANITLWIAGIVAVLAILFSLTLTIRDFIPNAIVGLFIRKKLNAKLGKQVKLGMISGRLEHVGIVASTIRNPDEQYVPHLYASKFI
jgi:small conductance mechanosensitive channel